MEERKINNIANKIKLLLFNYDLTVAYIQAEIDLRENQKKLIDLTVAAQKKKMNKWQQKRQIYLSAEIEIFENSLKELLERRNKLTKNISLILERFNNPGLMKAIFIDYFLKEEKTKEELINEFKITEEEFESVVELLNKQLITIYRI